ncbi:MAG: pyrroline-5-carboxylate reductase [Coriobacteriales bacterium]
MTSTLASGLGRVAIIGGGNMGSAVCAGLLGIPGMEACNITVANPGEDKRRALQERFGVRTVERAAQALPADTVFIAVKPAIVPQVAAELLQAGLGEDTLVVSVAAGVSTAKLSAALGGAQQLVRVMPNTPLTVGAGMSGVSGGQHASAQNVELVRCVFEQMGGAVVVPEDKQDVVTAISGSGPAYFELFLKAMAQQGCELGLEYESALQLALNTMYGTAVMLRQSGQDLDEAIKAVSSPGGTTVAALGAMGQAGVEEGIAAGVAAAAKRSAELGA